MGQALAERIKALLTTSGQQGFAADILKPIREDLTGLVPVKNSDYDNLRAIISDVKNQEKAGSSK